MQRCLNADASKHDNRCFIWFFSPRTGIPFDDLGFIDCNDKNQKEGK